MAKVRYIATDDPTDDQVCSVFGYTFAKGKLTEVPDEIAEKLKGNGTFEVPEPKAPKGE